MAIRERWGSFSVGDHRETEKLVTDVLAFDRLVFPVPPKDEKGERERWENEGWPPRLLDDRLRQLGDRAKSLGTTGKGNNSQKIWNGFMP
jgi:hypothetical protein